MESIQHFSHSEHPLILINKAGDQKAAEFVCYGCQKPISDQKDGYYACCKTSSGCNFYLHKKCADLPRRINLPNHEHPLTLLASPTYRYSRYSIMCGHDDWKWFTYNCSLCDFDVDVLCASLLLQEQKGNRILEHEGHPHPLTLQLRPSLFYCDACFTKEEDSSYFCNTCQFWIHNSCAFAPKSIKHAHHSDHPLFLAYSLPPQHHKYTQYCDICNQKVHPSYWFYYCDDCRYFNHLKCAIATSNTPSFATYEREIQAEEGVMRLPLLNHESIDPTSQYVTSNNRRGAIDKGAAVLRHRFHDHPLRINNDADNTINNLACNEILCDGCVRPISVHFYSCSECNFFLHKFCAELSEKLQCPHGKGHLVDVKKLERCDYFICSFCSKPCNGFTCKCKTCDLKLDIGCASHLLPNKIKHDSHQHPLVRIYISRRDQEVKCKGCGALTGGNNTFNCKACRFNLCIICLNYPRSIMHVYDRHSIPLSYPPIKDHPSEFICDICEKDINPRYWLYHCQDCNQSFHKDCLCPYDWFSNTKFGGTVTIESIHQHPLTFIRNSESKYASCLCDQCGVGQSGIHILGCAPCTFKLCMPCARKIKKGRSIPSPNQKLYSFPF